MMPHMDPQNITVTVKEGDVNDENWADINQALAAACAQKGVGNRVEASHPGSLRGRGLNQALVVSRK